MPERLGNGVLPAPQPGTITVKQMYVQYRIPKTVSGPAIVMVHGSGHTGATYETTPDGREGAGRPISPAWASRSTWSIIPAANAPASTRRRSISRPRRSQCGGAARHPDRAARARLVFLPHRRDLSDPVPRARSFRSRRPDQYTAQLVPNAEATLPGAGANTVQALAAQTSTHRITCGLLGRKSTDRYC